MKTDTPQQAVRRYYERFSTRAAHRFYRGNHQHFGYYDRMYGSESFAQTRYHQRLAKLLNLSPHMTVLDAGCGSGAVATYLAEHHDVAVSGISIAPHEIAQAQALARARHIEGRTHFIVADYAKPPFKPNSFDRIYTTETLIHAPDIAKVLDKFMKLLKPGGKLVCAEFEFDFGRFNAEDSLALAIIADHSHLHGARQLGSGQFIQSLKSAGFTEVSQTDWTQRILPSFRRLRNVVRPLSRMARSLRLDYYFLHTTTGSTYADWAERGVMKYKVYSAIKPGRD